MADRDDLRRVALALPDAVEEPGDPRFTVSGRQFVWTWRERVHPKRTKVPRPDVLVVRVPDLADKEALVASDPETFVTEPHYDGYPMVLVRLPSADPDVLAEVVADSYRCVVASRR
ncbi:MAG TPA: MmcQ/YjbR family DNA-binding protein [Angustibacter sp.]|nr:MmcQ/YjbR family DNA-binding protein [Angustibacter sp.]